MKHLRHRNEARFDAMCVCLVAAALLVFGWSGLVHDGVVLSGGRSRPSPAWIGGADGFYVAIGAILGALAMLHWAAHRLRWPLLMHLMLATVVLAPALGYVLLHGVPVR